MVLLEFFLNEVVDVALNELARHAHRIIDRFLVGLAVADDADAVDAQQRSSAVFGIIRFALHFAQSAFHKKPSDFGQRARRNLFLDQRDQRFRESLGKFEDDIADETVTHHHIHQSFRNIAAFDIPDEIGDMLLDEFGGGQGQFIPFGGLFPNRQDADFGRGAPEDELHHLAAHNGELQEVLGLAVDVGAGIGHDTEAGQGG